jgi:hypothetical protein
MSSENMLASSSVFQPFPPRALAPPPFWAKSFRATLMVFLAWTLAPSTIDALDPLGSAMLLLSIGKSDVDQGLTLLQQSLCESSSPTESAICSSQRAPATLNDESRTNAMVFSANHQRNMN